MSELGGQRVGAHGPLCQHVHRAIELIGRRWTGAIVFALSQGPLRFGAFKGLIPELSDRMLSERLKELEQEGVIWREVQPGPPVQVHYALTPKGEALRPIVDAIGAWAYAWAAPPTEGRELRSESS